jgi:phosphoribosylamine--glycine ligase
LRVTVVGSGGREHALGWKIGSEGGNDIVFLPGNGGTESVGSNVEVKADDVEAVTVFCLQDPPDLVVIGPEDPLAGGLSDRLTREGIRVFGPSADSTRLESSKAFAKEFMRKYSIPTASFGVFTDPAGAHRYVDDSNTRLVVKASGLAKGKGALVTATREEAHRAVAEIMEKHAFGPSGDAVVIEERLHGEEVSVLAVTDGENYVILPPSQDHKPAYDGDEGPNTGGMGAYCPAPLVDNALLSEVEDKVIKRTLKGLNAEGMLYKGVIYAGLMVNKNGVYVIEFNARFGDPEAQAILPAVDIDLGDLLGRAADRRLGANSVLRAARWAVCVVLASGGYPGPYEKGKTITGVEEVSDRDGVIVFHAGTRRMPDGSLVTSGGRVLGVTGCGRTLREAQRLAYDGCRRIDFEGKHQRNDIGDKGLSRLAKTEVS